MRESVAKSPFFVEKSSRKIFLRFFFDTCLGGKKLSVLLCSTVHRWKMPDSHVNLINYNGKNFLPQK